MIEAVAGTTYRELSSRHRQQFAAALPGYMARLAWPAERLAAERQAGLRNLIDVAKQRSPWHRERLRHIDAATVTEANLTSIPPMTKADLMANFDDIITEPRLSLGLVEEHLDSLAEDRYLLDEFHVIASGGSSGQRGIFVYGWQSWLDFALTLFRFTIRHQSADPTLGMTAVRGSVYSGKATHLTFAMGSTFGESPISIPASLSVRDIVAGLNAAERVDMVAGYPSMLAVLAKEALAGRLHIAPRLINVAGEPLLPEMREAMDAAWAAPIINVWGASEGPTGSACAQSRGVHLAEDLSIFELVDSEGRPVAPGQRAAKMYVTNLFNPVQPLIRYELSDEALLIDEPCPCGCAMRRIDDVQGRADDIFVYADGTVVHPLTFRSPLGHERHVVEYQVRQTPAGASVALRTQGDVDIEALSAVLRRELQQAGLGDPRVEVQVVPDFERLQTGKLKRFFPLL